MTTHTINPIHLNTNSNNKLPLAPFIFEVIEKKLSLILLRQSKLQFSFFEILSFDRNFIIFKILLSFDFSDPSFRHVFISIQFYDGQ